MTAKPNELLPCPFCASSVTQSRGIIVHGFNGCTLANRRFTVAEWNTRTALNTASTIPTDGDEKTVEAVNWFVREAARFADLTLGDDATVEQSIPVKHFRAVAAIAERAHRLQQTFDIRWEADMRGVARWREANPGNELVLPDRADLVEWLLTDRLSTIPSAGELREELRVLMLEQPQTGRRETYSDGFAMGLCEAIHRLDKCTALTAKNSIEP